MEHTPLMDFLRTGMWASLALLAMFGLWHNDRLTRHNAGLERAVDTLRNGLVSNRYHYRARHGWVYLVQDVELTSLVKIGRTNNIHRRMGKFDIDLPFKIEVLHAIETQDCVALETELHHRFAGCRVRGEWFALSPDDIAAIKRDYPS